MKNIINSSEIGGILSVNKLSNNSITFETTIPVEKVKSVRILGSFNANGEMLVNPFVEDIPGATITYHINRELDIATAYFPFGIPEELEMAISNYVIQEFEITLA